MASTGDDDFRLAGIEREATTWFVRLRNPQGSDRDAFREWLKADPRHETAYREVERLWRDLDAPAAVLAAEALAVPPRRRARGWARAAAVVTLIAAALALIVWRDPGLIDRARADHATRPGERLALSLRDGTAVYLDADSAVTETFGQASRDVTVLRGRVWFDVTADTARPFLVHADDIDVRAVGTAFGVDRERGLVTVEHGLVSVWESGDHFRLGAGQQVASVGGRLAPPDRVDPASALAWRRGLIVLDAAPLADVIREVDRMAGGRVIAPQEEVRALRLSGAFRADDPEALLEAMRHGLGLRTVSAPGLATIVYR